MQDAELAHGGVKEAANQPRRRIGQFSLRTLLWLMLLLALLLGWRASARRAELQRAQQANRLEYAEEELDRARDEVKELSRTNRIRSRVLDEVQLDGASLRGVTISSADNAFQRASLRECKLVGATLEGGGSAFQLARFDGADLSNAKLTGGSASFQYATFVDANLTGAVLTGGGASFQKASFENALLVDAKLVGSFQLVNISSAKFQGADLSALDGESLESCYFKDPPIYDTRTKFPARFDPAQRGWRRAAE